MAREPRTVLDICVARVGVHRGAVAAAAVAQYALTTVELGHVPTTDEYIAEWAISERTGWRHRERMTAVFGEAWPDVVAAVAAEVERRSVRLPARAMALVVPALAA